MDAGLMITLCLIFAALCVLVAIASVLLFVLWLELRKPKIPARLPPAVDGDREWTMEELIAEAKTAREGMDQSFGSDRAALILELAQVLTDAAVKVDPLGGLRKIHPLNQPPGA